jgi:hypothetical protein
MSKTNKVLTRRDVLRGAASAAVAGMAGASVFGHERQQEETDAPAAVDPTKKRALARKAAVILIRDPKVLNTGGQPRPDVLSSMLDEAVMALLGETKPEAAWSRLVRSSDTVGIKSNEWRFLPTPPALEEAIRQRVAGAGVEKERIGIEDRGVLHDPLFQQATALINVRPLRTHHWSGVGSCIKNYIMFTRAPWTWHEDSCANLAGLWELPAVKGKTRLNILVMLTPLFHGKGPHHFQAKYTWEYGGLIVGSDPVAVDATGVRILDAKRRDFFGQEEPFTTSPKHIQVAEEKYHLGVADPDRIDVQKLGWMDGALI